MCKRHFDKQRGACYHYRVADGPGQLIPADGCDESGTPCGIENGIAFNFASLTSRVSCGDCKARGHWLQDSNGKWYMYDKRKGEPTALAPKFTYPCQCLLKTISALN
ncbi:hypothetical protein AJ79_08448 [Helicocarpus griseus UAMH5409]|uniref:Uncharacterized protein n=1 Tax=Helicocarpus griseus UAMH5409 TaxID=1447875 RepID=A0A2B7WSP2_9EURO|nr:hypothetical protein AJ79_08448 [Helicocarpus griseus UAMH5409]